MKHFGKGVVAGMALLLSTTFVEAQRFEKHQPLALAVPEKALKQADNAEQIKRGAYLARAADCTSCHTTKGGQPYAGGVAFKTPFGTLYSTNISTSKQHGIGDWSAEDFSNALKQGTGKGGTHLYPAMPYPAYTRLTDQDVADLWAYFQQVRPVDTPNQENDLTWPFSWRGGMAVWNWMYLDQGAYNPESKRSSTWNRGAYLVQAAGHCGSCHTPRNYAMAEQAEQALSGNKIQGWYAPSLLSGEGQDLESWSVRQVERFLSRGWMETNWSAGPMSEAVHYSLQYLKDSDIRAIAVYLKSLRSRDGNTVIAERSGKDKQTGTRQDAANGNGSVDTDEARPDENAGQDRNGIGERVRAWNIAAPATKFGPDSDSLSRGERLYMDNCMACHLHGQGMEGAFPPIAGNSLVMQKDPTNLLNIILMGAQSPQVRAHPTNQAMPNFDWRLSDGQIADLATWLRATYSDADSERAQVSADQVAALRKREPAGED